MNQQDKNNLCKQTLVKIKDSMNKKTTLKLLMQAVLGLQTNLPHHISITSYIYLEASAFWTQFETYFTLKCVQKYSTNKKQKPRTTSFSPLFLIL